ncbi:glutathione S-transferase [Sphingorhabdus wooponensis]|uniref:Glutathione S-transferase n=1 Tax=Sphingorhabdus wooponensis TaxID=940136 RepID=A0A3R8WKP5_9SPHN|nr:glutathione S-transferase [Sphingorhabdus wooponensis]RRQ52193.1 glutathione S-transferase [Sphingorhabdus wooponensis]
MTALPILYSFRRCPYAMRARMAVAVSGVQVELREVVLRDKPPEMLEASPKGTVPVLVLRDGRVLEQSLDIMRWALAQSDPKGWLAHDDQDLVLANDGPFKQALDRYKYPHRYDLADGSAHRDAALLYLGDLNDRLAAAPYLGGAQPAFTDIAIFPFVRQFAATDALWFGALPLPALQNWLSALVGSDLFAAIMTRYPQWKAGDTPVHFP